MGRNDRDRQGVYGQVEAAAAHGETVLAISGLSAAADEAESTRFHQRNLAWEPAVSAECGPQDPRPRGPDPAHYRPIGLTRPAVRQVAWAASFQETCLVIETDDNLESRDASEVSQWRGNTSLLGAMRYSKLLLILQ
jgi:hypothetical protein